MVWPIDFLYEQAFKRPMVNSLPVKDLNKTKPKSKEEVEAHIATLKQATNEWYQRRPF